MIFDVNKCTFKLYVKPSNTMVYMITVANDTLNIVKNLQKGLNNSIFRSLFYYETFNIRQ